MSESLKIPSRAPALYLLSGIIGGLLIARIVDAPLLPALVSALILALLSLFTAFRDRSVWLFCFLTATLLAGWIYGTLRFPENPNADDLNRPIREAILEFEIIQILQERTKYGAVTGIGHIKSADPMSRLSTGARIFFRLDLKDEKDVQILRGSEIGATAVLIPIKRPSDPNSFESYLKGMGIHYRFERSSDLRILSEPSAFQIFCQKTNHRFRDYLMRGAPEDGDLKNLPNICAAMLLGQKAQLSPEQKERFRTTGTMHFFAISGLHIGVIATVIAQFLALIRIPRKLSPLIGLPLLFLYVEITGAPPSAVRAFLMALFFWMSFAFSRQRSPLAALAASAVFVLFISPEQLWSIGFQLSYLVVLSILLFGLPLHARLADTLAPFRYLPEASWAPTQRLYAWGQNCLLLLFSVSAAAWLASAPLSAGFFGFVTPGAILLNMLLVNLAALTISTGVITLFASIIGLEAFANFLNHAAWVSIYLMDQLVSASTRIPGMVIHCEGFDRGISYAALGSYFALLLWIHQKPLHDRRGFLWLLPPIPIITGVILGLNRLS